MIGQVRGDRAAAAALLGRRGVGRIFALLDSEGEEARIVGGAVRDALAGLAVSEIDFATTAIPQVVMSRAAAASIKSAPTGLDHGTVTLVAEGAAFEVTTLREDVDADGRRARVRFSRSFEEDAQRRDFTINALSLDKEGAVYDYVGALGDLRDRRVRFIGAPRARIREDFLRILRFFRFFSTFARGAPDAEALSAAIAERGGLDRLSRERIRAELLKLLGGARADEAAMLMSEAGLLQPLLGGIGYCLRLSRVLRSEDENPADPVLRLAALAVAVEDDAYRLRDRLRLSNVETERLAAGARLLAQLHARDLPPPPGRLREMLFANERAVCLDALALAQSGSQEAADPRWRSARAFLRDTPQPVAPFSGGDLLARGVPSGRLIGETLKKLQARWIRAGFPSDAASLARLIDEAVDEARRL